MRKRWFIGIDEAGRGPFAGPVTLAVFVFPRRGAARFFRDIHDSKKLTPKAREEWFRAFRKRPDAFFRAASVGARAIDRWGITGAIRRGMARLLKVAAECHKSLRKGSGEEILLDGSLAAPARYLQKTIIKGDERVPVIAAASIVAKVTRDRRMVRLARKFPQYGFEIHKGYGTKLHRERIRQFGLSEIHRASFCKKYAPPR